MFEQAFKNIDDALRKEAGCTTEQQAFLDFVLQHYVSDGVAELDQAKLSPLLRLRYQDSISDALADLGPAPELGAIFAGFQRSLYYGAAG